MLSEIRSPALRIRAGFSLIELMVVIAIIGLLAGATAVGVRSYLQRGREARVRMDLVKLEEAVESFFADQGRYPTAGEGLSVLARPPQGGAVWLKRIPRDPWGNDYIYRPLTDINRPYEVVCWGADGQEGGTADAADLANWMLHEAP